MRYVMFWSLIFLLGFLFGEVVTRLRRAWKKKALVAAERRRLAVLLVEQFKFVERWKADVALRGFTDDLLVAHDAVARSPFVDIRTEMRRVLVMALVDDGTHIRTMWSSLDAVVGKRTDALEDTELLVTAVEHLLARKCADEDESVWRDRVVGRIIEMILYELQRLTTRDALDEATHTAIRALQRLPIEEHYGRAIDLAINPATWTHRPSPAAS